MSQKIAITETRFRGLDATTDPLALGPGVLQELTDGMIVAGGAPGTSVAADGDRSSGGLIQTRPGKRALLSATLPGPITAMKRFRQADGTRSLLLAVASSSGATTGSIYRYDKGDTTCTELTDLGAFNVYDVQFAVLPAGGKDFCYIIGNEDGDLRRTDLTTFEVATGLDTPSSAPTVALTNLPIDSAAQNAPAHWAADTLSGTLGDVANSDFAAGSLTGWTTTGTVEAVLPPGNPNSIYYVRLDDAPSSLLTTAAIVVNAKANTLDTASPTRYATHFRFTGTFYTDSGGAQDGVTVTVIVYSDTGATTEIARFSQEFAPGAVQTDVALSHVFAFDFLDDSQPRSYKVVLGPGSNCRPGTNGPYLTAVHVTPYTPTVTFAQDGSQVAVGIAPLTPGDLNLYWGGLRLAHELASATDLSTYQTIALPLTLPADVAGLRARLGLKTADSAAPVLTDPLTLALSDAGQKYWYVDISTIAAGDRDAVEIVEVIFLADAAVVAGQANGGVPIEIGVLANAGGLSLGRSYYWRFTESEGADASRIESGGSPLSVSVTTDGLHATATLVLPAPTNGDAEDYAIWRAGGVLEAGFYYLENRLPVDADASGTGWTWDFATRTYTTAIPDSALLYADLFADHNGPPSDADAIAVYQGRLLLGVGRALYVSRLELGIAAGLYFNDVPNPAAPDFEIQGNKIVVGGSDGGGGSAGDAIRRITPFQSRAVVFLENGLRIFSGLNNLDFELKEYQQGRNTGLLASGAAAVAGDAGLMFLASDGLHAFDLVDDSLALGRPIARLLNPAAEFAGDALTAAAYARCSLLWHAGRLLLSAPISAADEEIGTTYVLDIRNGGFWYEWRLGAVLCGESFSGSGDQDDLIVGAADGMLYSLGNAYGDTSLSGDDPAAVTLSLLTRAFALAENEINARDLGWTVSCADDAADVDWSVVAEDAAGKTAAGTYAIASGETTVYPPLLLGSHVRGRYVTAALSIASVSAATLHRLSLAALPGRPI